MTIVTAMVDKTVYAIGRIRTSFLVLSGVVIFVFAACADDTVSLSETTPEAESISQRVARSQPPLNGDGEEGAESESSTKSIAAEKAAPCKVPNCPVPKLSYSPDYPVMGQYSVPNTCVAIHDKSAVTVTLKKGETMASAVLRLQSTSPSGGIVAIPWGHPVQCDSLRLTRKTYFPDGITLRGISGPNAEQPRFYCRSSDQRYRLGGTISHDQVAPTFFSVSSDKHHKVMIENIHVDGYKSALKFGSKGTNVIRNSWFHHGPLNGISNINTGGRGKAIYKGIDDYSRFSLEACGIEIDHYGQANHTHNFYMHRGLGGGGEDPELMKIGAFDTWSEVTLVDSLCHSPGWASCFKSIANKNNIINNKFYSELVTDPGFLMKGKQAQMLIDVPSCSHNIITGNELHNFKPTKGAGGSAVIGLRGRRTAMRGCEVPLVWYPYTNRISPVPLAKNPDAPIHTNTWWAEREGQIFFPTIFENNLVTVSGEFSQRQTAIHIYGSYWIYEGPKKVTCFLETPDTWYERSRVYASNNTYRGFKDVASIYSPRMARHNRNCANQPRPKGPGPTSDLFEIGEGETYE